MGRDGVRPLLKRRTPNTLRQLESRGATGTQDHGTSVTPKKGPLRLIVLYTCISLRGMIFMGFPSYFGTKTAAGTMIGKYFMGQT
jgi:hypothetical protein